MRKSGWSVACDQSIQPATRARSAGSADHNRRMAWDSHTARSPSSITDASMGVQRAKRRLVEPSEAAAGGDVLVGKTELADEPKHFLDIEGVAASPNLEH